MPPHILKQAIERYVLIPGKNFLPKAAELVEIARAIVDTAKSDARKHPTDIDGYTKWFNETFTFAKARVVHKKHEPGDDSEKPVRMVDLESPFLASEHASPLTDAEIRTMPEWIIKMGITIGDLDADHCARIRSA